MGTQHAEIVMQELTDTGELAKARKLREQFDRNSQWLQSNIADVYSKHRGKFICIAGQEPFIATTISAAVAKATAAHPEDEGWFTRYIPLEKVARVYAI
jgi:hypothetical protein